MGFWAWLKSLFGFKEKPKVDEPVEKSVEDTGDKVDWARFKSVLRAQLGKPYRFGAEVKMDDPSPQEWDCSELVEWAYHQRPVLSVITDMA